VEELGGLGSDTGDAHEIREPGGHLAAQRLERLHPARLQILADLAGQIGSDPGDLVEPPPVCQGLEVLGERFQISRGAPVGADTERVLSLELEQVRDEVEAARDLELLHVAGRLSGAGTARSR